MAGIGAEVALAAAFTLISLMVPVDLIKKEPESKIGTFFKTGMPNVDGSGNHDAEYAEQSFGGNVPTVAFFGVNGDRLGFYRNDGGKDKLSHGSTKQVAASFFDPKNRQTAEYMTVTASGFDATCISLVQVTHPDMEETYSYLPGEIAAVCENYFLEEEKKGDPDAKYLASLFKWSHSVTTIQFQQEGQTQDQKPKCMWIDSKDEHGEVWTKAKGWSIRLPDFRKNNQTYKAWSEDAGQMCHFASRFRPFEHINEYMCPEIFETAPTPGQVLGLEFEERHACLPNLYLPPGETAQEEYCNDARISIEERVDVSRKFHRDPECAIEGEPRQDWENQPIQNRYGKRQHRTQGAKRTSQPPSSSKSIRQRKKTLQDRFAGQLVKSRDPYQSAREVCASRGSVGPNWYSYHERRFCDMQKRKLYPVCETAAETETECFDLQLNETRHSIEKRGETVRHMRVLDLE